MPFIPVPNTAKLEVIGTQDGVIMENVLHFEFLADPSIGELENLCVEARDAWDVNISPIQSNDFKVTMFRATSLAAEAGPGFELAVDLQGDNNTGALPTNVTVSVKLTTGLTGRSRRGRLYHMGLPIAAATNSQLSSGWPEFLIDGYTDFLDTVNVETDAKWVVTSFVENGAPRAAGLNTPITGIVLADTNLDSQRRRLPGRGN